MIIVGVDVETTGLTDDREVVEFGFCVWDTETDLPLAYGSDVFKVKNWDEEAMAASEVHKISESMSEAGLNPARINYAPKILEYKPELIVAYNATFDHGMVKKYWPKLCDAEWLCVLNDLDHSKITGARSFKLMHLALEYGIPVIGWHRAMRDAEVACMIAAKHDLREAAKNKNLPRYRVSAMGSYNEVARLRLPELGLRWNTDPKKEYVKDNVLGDDLDVLLKKIESVVPGSWAVIHTEMPPKEY